MMSSMDRFLMEDRLWVISSPTHVPIYDFDFRGFFDCRCPYEYSEALPAIARIGAIPDYAALYAELQEEGITLVHTPEQHDRVSFLPGWYPLLEDCTPRSKWFDTFPEFAALEKEFGLPLFLKGARQTSRHSAALSIIRNKAEYDQAVAIYRNDPILRWQQFVCREFVPLRAVPGGDPRKISASFEFRTFWWRGQHVGSGPYWYEAPAYSWTASERDQGLALAAKAARKLDSVFVVIDIAMTADGEWIVIECNAGMESGYAGASPFQLWRNVLDIEAGLGTAEKRF